MKKEKNLAKGIGIAIGSLVVVLTGNIGLWLPVGLAIGAGVGNSLQKK